ncbi:hypothetical protein GCM10007160_09110 [Litchfieldella qijiaojingensis]|uniref:Uncharacterized protein n=1 Tax=Litchfieldella qijiaojingensis TaxID=980347 RepID=A0ABQ2YHN4_9GAMM|nr:hypothetical protein GCM10007160_09110 [Halomonas qijiaojingensis]
MSEEDGAVVIKLNPVFEVEFHGLSRIVGRLHILLDDRPFVQMDHLDSRIPHETRQGSNPLPDGASMLVPWTSITREMLNKSTSEMKRKAHGAQEPEHMGYM